MPTLRAYLARRVPRDQVDDLLQETMLRLHQRQAADSIDNLSAYAFQTARSVIIDRSRRQTVRKGDFHTSLLEAQHPVDHITPEKIAIDRDTLHHLASALHELPQRTRDIFILHRFEEMSYPDIARHMDISLSAVGKHMVKALRFLAQQDLL